MVKRTKAAAASAAGTALIAGIMLAGCAAPDAAEPEPVELASFDSIEVLTAAVNGLHGCDPETATEPVAIVFDGHLPEYAMCTDALQLVRYQNAEDRATASDLMAAGGENAPAGIAEGSNWHVFALPNGAEAPGEKEMKDLAYQLGGQYVSLPDPG